MKYKCSGIHQHGSTTLTHTHTHTHTNRAARRRRLCRRKCLTSRCPCRNRSHEDLTRLVLVMWWWWWWCGWCSAKNICRRTQTISGIHHETNPIKLRKWYSCIVLTCGISFLRILFQVRQDFFLKNFFVNPRLVN